ncbi:MAG: rod shape-determining protein MreD [Acidobacteria bacterium]|nr:rod shape-determining protein MreD [Acidobacteriota bacterium]
MPLTWSPTNKTEIYRFSPIVLILAPLFALVIQTYLPLYITAVSFLDLPLLVVIYFGLARRNPVEGILGGAVIGMAQDALSRGPIGLLGSAKTVIGYVTSFASVRFTVEHRGVRAITIFSLYYLQFFLLYFFGTLMLGQPLALGGANRILAALVNTVVGVLLFEVLDRFRKPA